MSNNNSNKQAEPKEQPVPAEQFCAMQGLDKFNTFCVLKMYKGAEFTYSEWYEKLSSEFQIGDKK